MTQSHQQAGETFPFTLHDEGGAPGLIAAIESDALFPVYYNFFEEMGYEGNGPCWEGHISQILMELDADLLSRIQFDAEAGSLLALFQSEGDRDQFLRIICPVFNDFEELRDWVSVADRDAMDD